MRNRVWTMALACLLAGAAGQAQEAAIEVQGSEQEAKLVRQPKPVYPPAAKQARISGLARMEAVIARDGTVKEVTAISGHPMLVEAAVEAVRRWQYRPTEVDGQPVEVRTRIDVRFELAREGAPTPAPDLAQGVKIVKKVAPAYPAEAKEKGISGAVRLEAVIDKEGKVADVRVLSGDPLLVAAAVDAVKQWEYQATLINGAAVDVVTEIELNFSLSR